MKKITRFLSRLTTSIILAVALVAPAAHAAPSGLYLNPTIGTYALNSTFTSQIRFGGSTAGVRAHLTYDITRLTITGTSNSGSSFNNVNVNYDNTAGTISAESLSAANGSDNLVTTITFKTIAPGNAHVTFSGVNQRADITLLLIYTWSDTSTTSAVYTVSSAPAPSTPPAQGSSGSSGSTGGGQTQTPGGSPSQPATNPSKNNSSSPITTPKPDGNKPTEPSSPQQQSTEKQKTARGVSDPGSALPSPDEPYSIPVTIEPKNKSPFLYLPAALMAVLALTAAAGVFIAYRKTHLSNSLRRLVTAATLTAGKSAPIVRTVTSLAPKLLAVTSPKLLASGIKKRLLLTAGKKTPASKS